MGRYKKAFLVAAIVVSLPLCFSLIAGLVRLNFIGLGLCARMLILWWGMYFYLNTASKLAFWLTFLLVNLHWWPLLFRSVHRVLFVIENVGGGRAYSFGSFMAYLTHGLFELIFFVPLTFALVFGVLAIKNSNKAG
jgi:hypothetical protein